MKQTPFPDKKYQIIYADPPWSFKAWNPKTAQRYVGNQYPTMTLSQLKELPVNNISADNSVLLLWATFPIIKLAIAVMEACLFQYNTNAFVWIKTNKKTPLHKRLEINKGIKKNG